MGGALMQLVAYGAQDVYLTGNPQITFWKKSWKATGLYYNGYVQGNPFSFPYYSNQYIGVIKTVASA